MAKFLKQLLEKIINLTLRKTIFIYMLISLVVSFILSAMIVQTALHTQNHIWIKYIDRDIYYQEINGEGADYTVSIKRPSSIEMTSLDNKISEFCDFLQTYTILIITTLNNTFMILIFYRAKLKKPIEELHHASQKIAKNDLDIPIIYQNQDEMGQLCKEFDHMRKQLVQNNKQLWSMIEEEKILRSAISHDIRSPLAVLKGYQEMLIEYVPDGTLDTEKTVQMLEAGMRQINRIDEFIITMSKLNSLEHRELKVQSFSLEELRTNLQSEVHILTEDLNQKVTLDIMDSQEMFYGDREVIQEVIENVLSNSFHHAKNVIDINIYLSKSQLRINITDDGKGFLENSEVITQSFYSQNIKDSLQHTGLGLYISRLYCEKHNGELIIENKRSGGASVTAIFGQLG